MADCVFCSIVSGAIPSTIVYQDEDMFAFRDVRPVAPTHILVIPRQHVSSIAEVDDPALLGKLMMTAREVAVAQGLTNGFRLVVNTGTDGGQTVPHLHVHLLAGRHLSWPPG